MEILHFNMDMSPDSRWEILSPTMFAKKNFLYLQEAGRFEAAENYYTVRKGLDSHLIKMTLKGQGILEYEGQTYTVPPNSLFWIDCQKPQNYYTDPAVGHWCVLWVHFNGATANAYYEAYLAATKNSPVTAIPMKNHASELLSSLLHESEVYNSDVDTDVYISSLLTSLLASIIHAASMPQASNFSIPIIEQIKNYLSEHFNERISLGDLAQKFNLSKYYLQRLFTQHVGVSPAVYQNMLRIKRAKELLRSTDAPISEISYRIGIENTSYFINLFKQQENITPQKYRKSWSEIPNE